MKVASSLSTVAALLLPVHGWDYKQQGRDWTEGMCSTGTQQSPVSFNTTTDIPNPLTPGFFTYNQNGLLRLLTIENNGETFQVTLNDSGHHVEYGGETYELKQYHFHSPGEHVFDNKTADLELHMLHTLGEGDGTKYLNIAIFWMVSATAKDDYFLADVMREKGELHTRTCFTGEEPCLDPRWALRNATEAQYISYQGSLTSPPCTERVTWIFDSFNREAPQAQIDFFANQLKYEGTLGNYREAPDKNKNVVYKYMNATYIDPPSAAFSARGVSMLTFAVAGAVAMHSAGFRV